MAKPKADVFILSDPQAWIFKLHLISVLQLVDKTKEVSAVGERCYPELSRTIQR